MAKPTKLDDIEVGANQKFTIALTIQPADGVDLTGAVVTSSIRDTASAETSLIDPTVMTALDVDDNLVATISYTEADSYSLQVTGNKPTDTRRFYWEVEVALADDPTHPSYRFWT
jgi:hypothetical protein